MRDGTQIQNVQHDNLLQAVFLQRLLPATTLQLKGSNVRRHFQNVTKTTCFYMISYILQLGPRDSKTAKETPRRHEFIDFYCVLFEGLDRPCLQTFDVLAGLKSNKPMQFTMTLAMSRSCFTIKKTRKCYKKQQKTFQKQQFQKRLAKSTLMFASG